MQERSLNKSSPYRQLIALFTEAKTNRDALVDFVN